MYYFMFIYNKYFYTSFCIKIKKKLVYSRLTYLHKKSWECGLEREGGSFQELFIIRAVKMPPLIQRTYIYIEDKEAVNLIFSTSLYKYCMHIHLFSSCLHEILICTSLIL